MSKPAVRSKHEVKRMVEKEEKDHKTATATGVFKTKKLNDVKVEPIANAAEKDGGRVKGAALFPEPFANIALIGAKKNGKTSVIFKIIKECVTPGTVIYVFCSTINKDHAWLEIREWCRRHGIQVVTYTNLRIGKDTHLSSILEDMTAEKVEEPESDDEKAGWDSDAEDMATPLLGSKKKKKAKRKPKYVEIESMFIFDDVSDELKHGDVAALMKKNRHFKSKVVISTQYVTDLPPSARRQVEAWLLFPHLNKMNLSGVLGSIGFGELAQFEAVYKQATARPFNFLYVDVPNKQYRHNFDKELMVPDE